MSTMGKLRRIALHQQGLLRADSFGRGKAATLRAIEHLGYVQIDTISVVERAHHHVLWSRVSNYQPKFLDKLVEERKLFEYWFHAASWLPMRDYRFALPRMNQQNGERGWFESCDKKLLRHILKRVREEGPLRARDFEDTRSGKQAWWDWKPAKQALEQLFMQGELMVSGRQGFQKVYDLRERVLPDQVDTREPTLSEYASHLVDTSLRAHGFAALKSFSYLRKGRELRDAILEQLQLRIEAGSIITVPLKDKRLVYADAELFETCSARGRATVKILSPFDNAVIQRERGRDVFDFDYQIECYLPQARRQYGYFCLPILYRERLVGRIDCKAHRRENRLEVKSVSIEQAVDDGFAHAFSEASGLFARFNHCSEISDLDLLLKELRC